MKRRIVHFAAVLATLPFVGAAYCGPSVDYTETYLITDPIDRIEIDVDEGTLDAVAYPRVALLLKRHTFGFERVLNPADYSVQDGVIHFSASCSKPDVCSFDHMIEAPLGIEYDVLMEEGLIDVGYIDGDITVELDSGWMRGIRLASPRYSFTATEADLELDFAAAPESLDVDIERGDIELSLPTGSYRCDIDVPGDATFAGAPVVCDDAATAVIGVRIGDGSLELTGSMP